MSSIMKNKADFIIFVMILLTANVFEYYICRRGVCFLINFRWHPYQGFKFMMVDENARWNVMLVDTGKTSADLRIPVVGIKGFCDV